MVPTQKYSILSSTSNLPKLSGNNEESDNTGTDDHDGSVDQKLRI